MPITYTTSITGLRTRAEGDLTDVVRVVDFTVSGADGDARFEIRSSAELRNPVDPETFVPMTDLTEEQVVGWLDQAGVLVGIKENVRYQIEYQQAQAQLSPKPLPWLPLPP